MIIKKWIRKKMHDEKKTEDGVKDISKWVYSGEENRIKIFEMGESRIQFGIEARNTVMSYFDEKEYVKKQVNIINTLLKHGNNGARNAAF